MRVFLWDFVFPIKINWRAFTTSTKKVKEKNSENRAVIQFHACQYVPLIIENFNILKLFNENFYMHPDIEIRLTNQMIN